MATKQASAGGHAREAANASLLRYAIQEELFSVHVPGGGSHFVPRHFRAGTLAPRDYQVEIALSALKRDRFGAPVSTLVVLPTALGKTFIAAMVADAKLDEGRIIFAVPTSPLTLQHRKYLKGEEIQSSKSDTNLMEREVYFKGVFNLAEGDILSVTGEEYGKGKRKELYSVPPKILIATSQVLSRDIAAGRLSLKGCSLLILDEAHNAVGGHSHSKLAWQARDNNVPILALTASPGDSINEIVKLISGLGVNNIEIRRREDHDIAPYVQNVVFVRKEAVLPTLFTHIRNCIHDLAAEPLAELGKMGILGRALANEAYGGMRFEFSQLEKGMVEPSSIHHILKFGILDRMEREVKRKLVGLQGSNWHEPSFLICGLGEAAAQPIAGAGKLALNHAQSLIIELFMYERMLRLFETESIHAGLKFIENNFYGGSTIRKVPKYKQRIACNLRFKRMYDYLKHTVDAASENPKIKLFKGVLEEYKVGEGKARFICFTEYKEQAFYLKSIADGMSINAGVLCGKGNGVTEKDRTRIIEDFKAGRNHLLISTPAGQEGLDMPSANVINYDQVGTAIRSTQRNGRAARTEPAVVVNLVALDTADTALMGRAEAARERMARSLIMLKRDFDAALSNGRKGRAVDLKNYIKLRRDNNGKARP